MQNIVQNEETDPNLDENLILDNTDMIVSSKKADEDFKSDHDVHQKDSKEAVSGTTTGSNRVLQQRRNSQT
jgi:hypothetical protein